MVRISGREVNAAKSGVQEARGFLTGRKRQEPILVQLGVRRRFSHWLQAITAFAFSLLPLPLPRARLLQQVPHRRFLARISQTLIVAVTRMQIATLLRSPRRFRDLI